MSCNSATSIRPPVIAGTGCDYSIFRGNISGITNKIIRMALPDKTSSQISQFLRRCRLHGRSESAAWTYKCYFTKLGKQTIISALKIHQCVIVSTLAAHAPA